MTFTKVHKRRLLKAAEIVEKVPRHLFDMGVINHHECGSPACVLGHYGRAHPKIFKGTDGWLVLSETHFGLTSEENEELFLGNGCNNAKTGKQAAKYIRQFVARKEE